jgi:hypothetical protein
LLLKAEAKPANAPKPLSKGLGAFNVEDVIIGPGAPPKLMSKLARPAQSLLTVAYSLHTMPVVVIDKVTVGVA